MSFRLVKSGTTRIKLGDDDWLEVRPEVTKKEFNEILSTLPEDVGETGRVSFADSEEFLAAVFTRLVRGWSVVDEEGNPVPATVDNFLELPRSAAQIIERAVMAHFNSQEADEDTVTKSDEPSAERSTRKQRQGNSTE